MQNTLILAALLLSPLATLRAADDIVLADFEGPTFGDWKVEGEAFGSGPVERAVEGQAPVDGFAGKRFVTSKHGGDKSTGTLTSPMFKIQRHYLNFLIGGAYCASMKINLLIDGKIVRSESSKPPLDRSLESLDPAGWDVSEFAGKEARIQVVDDSAHGDGYLNLDQIVQSDSPHRVLKTIERGFVAEKQYLNFPLKFRDKEQNVSFLIEGKPESAFSTFRMSLAGEKPEWWGFRDISAFKGKKITLQVQRQPEGSTVLNGIEQSDQPKGLENLYQEKRRPQYHFSTMRGSSGDVNGPLYYKGEYHVFWQHNPYHSQSSANTQWGHAVSTDLVHWQELPAAIYPDDNGLEWSGTGVVDWNNTSGFQTGEEKPLVLIYAAAGRRLTQCIAYSNDKGRSWTKYAGNPVLPFLTDGNRDPKVFWYEPEKKWVMVLAFGHPYARNNSGKPNTNPNYGLFSSKDLKKWERMSSVYIDDTEDCPEFFEIAVDGDKKNTKWVIYSGAGKYLIGTFDGTTFKPESGPHNLSYGSTFYASQTISDIPKEDGRRILMANSAGGGGDGSGFWGSFSTAVELTLRNTDEGLRLHVNPVQELERIRVKTHNITPMGIGPDTANPLFGIQSELVEITAEIALGNAKELGFKLHGAYLTYDVEKQEVKFSGRTAILKPVDGKIQLHLFIDRTSLDIFGNHGRLYMPMGAAYAKGDASLSFFVRDGTANIVSLQVYELESIWKAATP